MVDHDTGRLVWAHEGRNKDTLSKFFQDLGQFQIRCVDACVGQRLAIMPFPWSGYTGSPVAE